MRQADRPVTNINAIMVEYANLAKVQRTFVRSEKFQEALEESSNETNDRQSSTEKGNEGHEVLQPGSPPPLTEEQRHQHNAESRLRYRCLWKILGMP